MIIVMAEKTRYALVGAGHRSGMFTDAIVDTYRDISRLVGICDPNQGRMDLKNRQIAEKGHPPVPTYKHHEFDRMVAQTKPDVIVVTSLDVTHSDYICRAMELGCDVITEKPMTIDEARCRKILQTQAATGRKIQVTFNYRYSPPRMQIKEILSAGTIGEVLSVDFAWCLDTRHGADYFRRWHRRREYSGSLLVHKATHHFDLVNWWLDDLPEDVFAHGTLKFYTPQNADALGLLGRSERCLDCPVKADCKFYLDLAAHKELKELYLDNEAHDGYFRDRCVFSEDIDIWDNMSVAVRYRRGALLSYMLHSYSPWEGYRIAFNGTKGRLEHSACENTYISGDGAIPGELTKGRISIRLIPAFSPPQIIAPRMGTGGHGGGDPELLSNIFDPTGSDDPLNRKADHRDGAYSILTGIAAARSIDTGNPINIADLLGDAPVGE